MAGRQRTISIRITVLTLFILVSCLTAGLSLGLQYYFSRDLAATAAEGSFRITAEKINERIQALDRQSADLVRVLGYFQELETYPGPDQERRALPLLAGAMEQTPSLYAIYVGYLSGDYFEVINLESSDFVRKAFGAAPVDRWLVLRVSGRDPNRIRTFSYLDQDFQERYWRMEETDYDPRGRPWFNQAVASPAIIKTDPYVFSNLKAPGVTYAKSMSDGERVVAVDISLAGMTAFLRNQRFQPHSEAFLFNQEGELIARASHEEQLAEAGSSAPIELTPEERAFVAANPVILASNEMDWPPFDFALSGKPRGYSVDLLNLLAGKAGLRVEYVNGYSWGELVQLFKLADLDILHSLVKDPWREQMGIFTRPYMPLPPVLAVRTGSAVPESLAQLAGKSVAIPRGWATADFIKANHPDIKLLYVGSTLEALRAVSEGHADATLDSRPVLRYLAASYYLDNLRIGDRPIQLPGQENQDLYFLVRPEKPLLASILNKALASLTPEERGRLEAKWFDEPIPSTEELKATGAPSLHELLRLAQTAGAQGDMRIMQIDGREYFGFASRIDSVYGSDEYLGLLVPRAEILAPYMRKVHYALLATFALLLLLIPVVIYGASIIVNPVKALALENDKVRQRRYDEVVMVRSRITEIHRLSRSMVTMAEAIKDHEKCQRELMDAFIRLIATAIDQKSPYTGGHCARVPELANMLAKAACDCGSGPLADFNLKTGDQWREFHIAAWLHDCGKVATPEYIVDKATKLEAIYNRINEVRMRFEVLLRDAEIDYWSALAKGGDEAALKKRLEGRRREIVDDFAFIAKCNVGGEAMDEAKIKRIKEIAGQTWQRNLDDRLGLGHLELARYPAQTPAPPCLEPLLSDRPEHVISRSDAEVFSGRESRFKMAMPEHLYNLGEIHNLCIPRGTLTPEDRYKINEHITTTIHMLETLPYPESLARIPEYAGAHHERLDGSGYPRSLTAEEIGIPARIMAIADVFEALTAPDRPYKKSKPLSQAVRILSLMVKNNHLDANLFRLFLEKGVYLEYAKRFLPASQIDEVDVAAYLSEQATA